MEVRGDMGEEGGREKEHGDTLEDKRASFFCGGLQVICGGFGGDLRPSEGICGARVGNSFGF